MFGGPSSKVIFQVFFHHKYYYFIPLLLLITSVTGQVFKGTVSNTIILNSVLQLNVVRLALFLIVFIYMSIFFLLNIGNVELRQITRWKSMWGKTRNHPLIPYHGLLKQLEGNSFSLLFVQPQMILMAKKSDTRENLILYLFMCVSLWRWIYSRLLVVSLRLY